MEQEASAPAEVQRFQTGVAVVKWHLIWPEDLFVVCLMELHGVASCSLDLGGFLLFFLRGKSVGITSHSSKPLSLVCASDFSFTLLFTDGMEVWEWIHTGPTQMKGASLTLISALSLHLTKVVAVA